jgi:uncharacterized protein
LVTDELYDTITLGGIPMSKIISANQSVYSIVQTYPEIVDILVSLGFSNIVNPLQLQTVGRIMTLKKGAIMKQISMDKIIEVLKNHGYQWEESL